MNRMFFKICTWSCKNQSDIIEKLNRVFPMEHVNVNIAFLLKSLLLTITVILLLSTRTSIHSYLSGLSLEKTITDGFHTGGSDKMI